MITLPLWPIWMVDIIGSLGVLLVGWACFREVRRLKNQEPDNALYLYFYWLTLSLLAFGVSRSGGHLLQHLLVFSGHQAIWQRLQPVTGGFNTITFVVISAVGLFFTTSSKFTAVCWTITNNWRPLPGVCWSLTGRWRPW